VADTRLDRRAGERRSRAPAGGGQGNAAGGPGGGRWRVVGLLADRGGWWRARRRGTGRSDGPSPPRPGPTPSVPAAGARCASDEGRDEPRRLPVGFPGRIPQPTGRGGGASPGGTGRGGWATGAGTGEVVGGAGMAPGAELRRIGGEAQREERDQLGEPGQVAAEGDPSRHRPLTQGMRGQAVAPRLGAGVLAGPVEARGAAGDLGGPHRDEVAGARIGAAAFDVAVEGGRAPSPAGPGAEEARRSSMAAWAPGRRALADGLREPG